MNKILKITIVTLAVILLLLIISAALKICPPKGPWVMPPWCEGMEIKEGVNTKAKFFLSVPYGHSGDVELHIGEEVIKMEEVAGLIYSAEADVIGQQKTSYTYVIGDKEQQNDIIIKQRDQIINDGFSKGFTHDLKEGFTLGVQMFDTWGMNYNMHMFENTRNNIESSFDRLKRLGVKQTAVTHFLRPVYGEKPDDYGELTTDYEFEEGVFLDDHRDEAMTDEDMKKVVEAAHSRDIKIGVEVTFPMIDFGDYVARDDISEVWLSDQNKLAQDKTKEWVIDHLDKKEKKYLELAKRFEKAGFDYVMINERPTFSLSPHEEIENKRLKQLIEKIKSETDLEVHAYLQVWQVLDKEWNEKFDYYKTVDKYYIYTGILDSRYDPYKGMDLAAMKEKLYQQFADLDEWSEKPLNIMHVSYSYPDSLIAPEGILEISDAFNPKIKALEIDYEYQANVYEAVMQASEGKDVESVIFFGYWWDDAMDPDDAIPRISVSFSPRNKYAEAVVQKWARSLS